MQVFVVSAGDYDERKILNIYATEVLAQIAVARHNAPLVHRDGRGQLYNEAHYAPYDVLGSYET